MGHVAEVDRPGLDRDCLGGGPDRELIGVLDGVVPGRSLGDGWRSAGHQPPKKSSRQGTFGSYRFKRDRRQRPFKNERGPMLGDRNNRPGHPRIKIEKGVRLIWRYEQPGTVVEDRSASDEPAGIHRNSGSSTKAKRQSKPLLIRPDDAQDDKGRYSRVGQWILQPGLQPFEHTVVAVGELRQQVGSVLNRVDQEAPYRTGTIPGGRAGISGEPGS